MANPSMAITSAQRLSRTDACVITTVQRKTRHELRNDLDHGIGHGPEAGNADNNSDLRGRLNARHRFATFMMGERMRSASTARCVRERPHMNVRAGEVGRGRSMMALVRAHRKAG